MLTLVIGNVQKQIFIIPLNSSTRNNLTTLISVLVAMESPKRYPTVSIPARQEQSGYFHPGD